ncbi:HEAT repeat domain-containing protein [Clostridium sp. SYSU_GA19001]|uniref:HEAT repeat domain-containing protein n=1 Tax=Clostridium caldaquaticum TaxID=2940653 RepID=UPI0020770424|nr:HEAT repeat domain-containing protein [Clostridium caldaquaticum]MCM8710892.1 HEAT repeat domain-containing protein [Clostridium caldaquaticum]
MFKGLVKYDWNDVDKFQEEDITYFLSLEGKPIDAICRIRNLNKEEVQRHIIEGKIKYRFLVKSKSGKELFDILCSLGKQEKLAVLNSLSEENINILVKYIRSGYADMLSKSKENAIWILGELGSSSNIDILIKAMVHNHVNIRRMAVSAMGKIGDKTLDTVLIRALEDENPQVVLYAIKSLIKIKSEKAYSKIKNILDTTNKDYLKKAAQDFLDSINK